MPRRTVLFLSLLAVVWHPTPSDAAPPTVDYRKQIKPLLARHCNGCHGSKKVMSGFRTDAGRLATRGGDRGTGIVPGKPDKSLLFQVLTGTDDVERMPYEKPPLKPAEISLIKEWIVQGGKFPADEKVIRGRRTSDHWAFQPIVRAKLPSVSNPAWVRNAIDAFVLSRLDREKLRPAAEADRVTLLRRLSLDLLGLPPTPGQLASFLNDLAPGAERRLVDRNCVAVCLAEPGRTNDRARRHDSQPYGRIYGSKPDVQLLGN